MTDDDDFNFDHIHIERSKEKSKRAGEMRRLGNRGEEILLPCRYCGTDTPFSKEIFEHYAELWESMRPRHEPPFKNNEIAVCDPCRPRYLQQFCPDTTTITIKAADSSCDDKAGDVWPEGTSHHEHSQEDLDIPF
jgi:hypothetical protein